MSSAALAAKMQESRPKAEPAESPATVITSAAALAGRGLDATVKAPPPPPTVTARAPVSPAPTVKERSLEDTLKPPKPPAAPVGVVTRAPAPRSGLPLGLVLGGAGALFLLAAGFAGFVLLRRAPEPPPAPEPTPTPAPVVVATPVEPAPTPIPVAPGVLHVSSEPAGASVSLNGEARGTTPLDLGDLDVGIHELKVELKGYAGQTRSVTLTTEEPTQDVAFTLARAQPASGTVDILSTPFGASVKIDGAAAGETPLTRHRLKPGAHRVEVTIEGHEPWSQEISVQSGKNIRVDAQLAPIVVATPTPPPVVDPDPSKVYLPGEVDTPPRKLQGSVPYPSNAPKLRSGESASVEVSYVVDEEGVVSDPKVVESGGKILDEAVLNAVRNWKYQPGVKKGVKVKVRVNLRQTFKAG
jgi:TonB family protein